MKKVTLKYLLIGVLLGLLLINFSASAVAGFKDGFLKGTIFDLEDYTVQTNVAK